MHEYREPVNNTLNWLEDIHVLQQGFNIIIISVLGVPEIFHFSRPQILISVNLLYSGAPLTLGPTKIVHYREGVLWSGVYYTLCGLYWDSTVYTNINSFRDNMLSKMSSNFLGA